MVKGGVAEVLDGGLTGRGGLRDEASGAVLKHWRWLAISAVVLGIGVAVPAVIAVRQIPSLSGTAATSVAEAIAIVKRAAGAAEVLTVVPDSHNGQPVYVVQVRGPHGRLWVYWVGINRGQVIGRQAEVTVRHIVHSPSVAPRPTGAMAAAERARQAVGGGQVVGVRVHKEDQRTVYAVQLLLANGTVATVTVDMASGHVTGVAVDRPDG